MQTIQKSLFRSSSYLPRNDMQGKWSMMFFNGFLVRLVFFTISCRSYTPPAFKRLKVDPTIRAQMDNAIALWETACKSRLIPEAAQETILSRLERVKVPPIFHAYCAYSKNLSHAEKRPAPENVEIGLAEPGSTGALSIEMKSQYNDAFFDGQGKAYENVEDKCLNGYWKYCPFWTEKVVSLVNTEADMVGADVEITKLHGEGFPIEIPLPRSQDLITRPLSRGVVADCLRRTSYRENMCAIVGSPGIGKSWSLVYALQQALMYNDVCVVICFQKMGMAYACIRKQNQVFVWKASCPYPFSTNLRFDANVLVLLDPLESEHGGAQYTYGDYRVICAAAENDNHSGIQKDIPEYQRFLGPYTEAELSVALPFLMKRPSRSATKALDATSTVGMVPRYFRRDDDWRFRKKSIDSAIEWLKVHENELKLAVTEDGSPNIIQWGRNPYDSTIFTVCPDGSLSKNRTLWEVGYDGQRVNYGIQSIDFVSDYVREKLTSARKKL